MDVKCFPRRHTAREIKEMVKRKDGRSDVGLRSSMQQNRETKKKNEGEEEKIQPGLFNSREKETRGIN